ncbi:McrB family protein [Deinococcus sp. NW-56]|uniref:McrB family protein n=1 Tax=Deinococcus sp. NW-56 TaxID=2080419 RepID=UPI0018F8B2A6|nr:AAA family ATPase [Deinococcus sp. NW-56]
MAGELQPETFAAALVIYMVGVPRLTQGLFWLSPWRNLPLNGVNVPYLTSLGITGADRIESLADYQAVLEQAASLEQTFPELSAAAWVHAQAVPTTIRPVGDGHQPEVLFTPPADVPLNQILYGPPGTGKTYAVTEEVLRILAPAFLAAHGEPHQREALKAEYGRLVDTGAVTFVTFHQGFTYEDFIEGLKPRVENGQVVFREETGIFLDAVRRAGGRVREEDPELLPRAHVLVIDEINRGNVAKIFGELLTLLEDTKRAGASDALSVRLPVSRFELTVPPSLYIIGTMNTADRSLTPLDAALRRRFTFKAVWPDAALLPERLGVAGGQLNLRRFLEVLNDRLEERLTRDQLIGHAYLLNLPARLDAVAGALRNRILPLLEEYFFEDWPSIREVLGDDRKTDPADQFIHVIGEGERRRYRYNEEALTRLSAFTGVYDPA